MFCNNCSTIEPIEDQGMIHLSPVLPELVLLFREKGCTVEETSEGCAVYYSNCDNLLSLMQLMQELPLSIRQQLKFNVMGTSAGDCQHPWISLQQFDKHMQQYDVVSIILEKQFTSFMQPIVDCSKRVVAYEFLLRPSEKGIPFQPSELFEAARKTGLHSFLDRAARISAIETSAHWLPKGVKRFVNFLPSSIYNPEFCLSHTFETIERLSLEPTDFVFEVVETDPIDDVKHLQSIFEVYRRNGISVAMDDVGAGYSTLEQMVRLQPDYVKIDRSLIDHCDVNTASQKQLLKIVNTAREFGAKVLAEGIERLEEFEHCCEIGIELAQGYLFGKPASRPASDCKESLLRCSLGTA